jgi:hypothetical protein
MMGRIDPAPPRPGRGGSPAGRIVAGVLAIALAGFVAFEAGKRSHADREAPTVAAAPRAEASLVPSVSAEPDRETGEKLIAQSSFSESQRL